MTEADKRAEAGKPHLLPRIEASTLFTTSREIIIVHNNAEYRLRLTSNEKLILTK